LYEEYEKMHGSGESGWDIFKGAPRLEEDDLPLERDRTPLHPEITRPHEAVTLNADGFTLTFSPGAPYRDAGAVFFAGTVTLTSRVGQAPVLQTRIDCYLADLVRLCEWLEAHVQALLAKPDTESPSWAPLELEMEVTCLSGDAWHEDGRLAGGFTIRVLLEIGHAPNGTQVYGGFEGTVEVQAIADFTDSLTDLVAHYERIE
jgi:hypothetical protein